MTDHVLYLLWTLYGLGFVTTFASLASLAKDSKHKEQRVAIK